MLRFCRLLTLFVLAALLLAGCSLPVGDAPLGMRGASPDFATYDLFVPEDWVITQSGGAVSAYASAQDPTNVSVMSWSLPYADSTLAEWWEEYKEEFVLLFEDFTLETEEDTLLGGISARKYRYTGTLAGSAYRYTQFAAVKGGVIYLLTFTEQVGGADHTEDISAMATAFTWRE